MYCSAKKQSTSADDLFGWWGREDRGLTTHEQDGRAGRWQTNDFFCFSSLDSLKLT